MEGKNWLPELQMSTSTEQIFDWAKFRADSGVFDRRKKVFSRQKKRKKK